MNMNQDYHKIEELLARSAKTPLPQTPMRREAMRRALCRRIVSRRSPYAHVFQWSAVAAAALVAVLALTGRFGLPAELVQARAELNRFEQVFAALPIDERMRIAESLGAEPESIFAEARAASDLVVVAFAASEKSAALRAAPAPMMFSADSDASDTAAEPEPVLQAPLSESAVPSGAAAAPLRENIPEPVRYLRYTDQSGNIIKLGFDENGIIVRRNIMERSE